MTGWFGGKAPAKGCFADRTRPSGWAGLACMVALSGLLGGCAIFDSFSGEEKDDSDKEIAPKSQRISILQLQERLEPDPRIADLAVAVPRARMNDDWTQPGGTANNGFAHLQLGDGTLERDEALRKLWSVDAGAGSSRDAQLTAPPIIAEDRIFVLDADATVRAFERETGKRIWRKDLTPKGERSWVGFGGGVAYGEGKIIVANGFGDVVALTAADGEELWKRHVSVPIRSAPTVAFGRVFVTATDNQLHAYDLNDGQSLWTHRSMAEVSSILSAVSPAVDQDLVIAPFSSGELSALRVQNGRETWSDSLVLTGKSTAMAGINDIAARPVIQDGRIYAVSHSGRFVAIDERTGERVWSRNIAGTETPWISGDFIFMVTVDSEALCMSALDGRIRWLTRLKRYKDTKERKGAVAWRGPLLISERLFFINSLGEIAILNPADGEVLTAFKGPGETYITPVVAKGVVYILSDDGRLTAMR